MQKQTRATSMSELTPQEQRILALVQQGFTNSKIAVILGKNRRAVRRNIKDIKTKLNVQYRKDMVALQEQESENEQHMRDSMG
jgi:DNA-binding CsgD family transcriptional regulator